MLSAGFVISVAGRHGAGLVDDTPLRRSCRLLRFCQLQAPRSQRPSATARERGCIYSLLMIAVFMFMYLELAVMRLASS